MTPAASRLYSQAAQQATRLVRYPYAVPRNSNGNLPVYSDIRNGGSRYMVLVRNIDGDVKVCMYGTAPNHHLASNNSHMHQAFEKDLRDSLFDPSSPERSRMKTSIQRSRHLVLTGGEWKDTVKDWLARKGF
jgi:large subunit ribosomal protein L49